MHSLNLYRPSQSGEKNEPLPDRPAQGLDETAVRDALHHLRKTLPAEDHGAIDSLPLYQLAFGLSKRLLPV